MIVNSNAFVYSTCLLVVVSRYGCKYLYVIPTKGPKHSFLVININMSFSGTLCTQNITMLLDISKDFLIV